MAFAKLTRRQVLLAGAVGGAVTASGGLWFGIWKAGQRRWAKPVLRQQVFAPNVYLAIGEDDTVTVWLTKAEMGQGVLTALPMLVAEELDADFSKIRVEQATLSVSHDYGSLFTASSASVTSLWEELRKAGAAAREILLAEAAERLGVDAGECTVDRGIVSHGSSGKSVTFGALAKGASTRSAPLRPTLKRPEQFKLIGTPVRRLDLQDKTTGKAVFGLDVELDGAVWVAMRRCPVQGGTLKSVEVLPAEQVEGVERVLPLDDMVLVAANSTWAAFEGVRALEPEWELPPKPSSSQVESKLLEALEQEGIVVSDTNGSVAAPAASALASLDATYVVPFLAHATMEPPNCSALIQQGACTVWAPTQHPEGVREIAAEIAELPLSNVTVHRTLLGGGFGRRTQSDEAAEAVRAAKLLGKPVHLVWSREDDIAHDYYREAAAHALRGSIEQTPEGWRLRLLHRVATASGEETAHEPSQVDHIAMMGAAEVPYTVAGLRVEWKGIGSSVRTGIWRSVGYSHNTFALESFIDELCVSFGHDPLDARLKLLSEPRMHACVQTLRELSEWHKPRDSERALGIAVCPCFGSFIAIAVEVSRSPRATPRVERVWCVADVGLVVNPDTVEAQIEGGIVFGLTATLYGRITLDAGRVVESNFHNYPLLRQSETPEVVVKLLKSAQRPGGVGELSVPPVAPAVCNAWARLTGQRVRSLPFS